MFQVHVGISTGFPSNNRVVVRYRETENARQNESRLRSQGLSSESVVCRHLSRRKRPGNPLPSDEFIGNLWRGMGGGEDAKDLLFLLNLTVYGSGEWNCVGMVERLLTPERSKSKTFVISKGCSLIDPSSIEFEVISRLRDSRRRGSQEKILI